MKKVLSLLLVVCMLLTTLLTLSSCSYVTENAAKKDAQAVLSEAWSDTIVSFFDGSKDFSKIASEALKNGSLEIALQAELLEEEADIEEIKETLYFNENDKKIASQTSVVYDGKTLEALLFVDEGGITLSSKSILGSTTAYKLNPATLAEKFIDSDIAFLLLGDLNETSSAAQELQIVLDEVADAYKQAFETSEKDAEQNANDLLATLQQTVEAKKVENLNGKSAKCVVTTYKITNDTLVDFINKAIDIADVDDEDLLDSVDELTEIIEDELELDLAISIYINQYSGLIEQITVKGTAVADGSELEIDVVLSFSDEKIELNAAAEVDGDEAEFVATIEKTVDGKDTTYTFTAGVEYDGDSEELFEASLTTNKDSGDFELTIKANDLIDKKVVIKGNSKAEDGTATLQIASVKYGSTTVDFDLKFTFKKSATMPTVPGEVKDVVDLTDEDIENIAEALQESVLADLF